jgi:hypothetical protein
MIERKWFIDKNGGLSDLHQFNAFFTAYVKEKDKIVVAADLEDGNEWIFGTFDTKQEAIDYIKEIHTFLIAE